MSAHFATVECMDGRGTLQRAGGRQALADDRFNRAEPERNQPTAENAAQ